MEIVEKESKSKDAVCAKPEDWRNLDIVEIDFKNRQILVCILNDINFLNNKAKTIMDAILNCSGVDVMGDTFELTKDCSLMVRKKAAAAHSH
ncbi:MAG: hypothetical protein NUV76_12290 [Candidatus Kuenenia sp.]|nr:hypothetical protein [Candidatus Kuenenia sp.]